MKRKILTIYLIIYLFLTIQVIEASEKNLSKLTRYTKSRFLNGYYLYSWSPDFKKVAVVLETDNNKDIWAVDNESGEETRITNDQSQEILPSWSPDGKHIAYISDKGGQWWLWSAQSDGTRPKKLFLIDKITPLTTDPVWSPDGKRILTISYYKGNWDLWSVDRIGESPPVKITGNDRKELSFSWIDNGSRIVYASTDEGRSHICVINSDGTNEERLTDGDGVYLLPNPSPDGKQISYVSGSDMSSVICTMNVDGSASKIISKNRKCINTLPRWSPDGKRIAFVSNMKGNMDLWMMNNNGDEEKQLTSDCGSPFGLRWLKSGLISCIAYKDRLFDFFSFDPVTMKLRQIVKTNFALYRPCWSFDGKYIITSMQEGRDIGIFLIERESKISKRIFSEAGNTLMFPAVNPVDKKIAFTAEENNLNKIWIGNYADESLKKISNDDYDALLPSWSPDGMKLAYISGNKVEETNKQKWHLKYMDIKNGNSKILTEIHMLDEYSGSPYISWSPDSKRILISDEYPSGYIIKSIDIDKGKSVQLYRSKNRLMNPAFSCDAKFVFFVEIKEESEEILKVDMKDLKAYRLTNSKASINPAQFSVFDEKIIYTQNSELWSMNIEGRNKKQLIFLEGDESYPVMSPDGKSVLFQLVRGNSRDIYTLDLSN